MPHEWSPTGPPWREHPLAAVPRALRRNPSICFLPSLASPVLVYTGLIPIFFNPPPKNNAAMRNQVHSRRYPCLEKIKQHKYHAFQSGPKWRGPLKSEQGGVQRRKNG
ncbi:hypothetical protein NMG60_11031410 [Bertholletia excelsa]